MPFIEGGIRETVGLPRFLELLAPVHARETPPEEHLAHDRSTITMREGCVMVGVRVADPAVL